MKRFVLRIVRRLAMRPFPTRVGLGVLAVWSLTAGISAAADGTARGKTYEVDERKDIAYKDGPGAHKVKHKLDLFLPRGAKDYPVLFFVHGGGWRHGDKNYFFGVYSALGNFYARHGIGTVVINYRLSPEVVHPEHIKDVARAFAWTHENIAKYGGNPDRIFACGHSAGGHLVSLLATDDTYLKAEGLTPAAIKGVIPISGVYTLPDGYFNFVFGKDPEVRKKAFPINHVTPGLPPFLIIYADSDYPGCDAASELFAKTIKAAKGEVETLEVAKRNHFSIITGAGVEDDPTATALLKFIASHPAKLANVGKEAPGTAEPAKH